MPDSEWLYRLAREPVRLDLGYLLDKPDRDFSSRYEDP